MKQKSEPECRWCYEDVCCNDGCPARGDFCPVQEMPGLCIYEEREEMTPKKAWQNIAERLKIYAREHGFNDDDMAAEVMAYRALCDAEEVVNE